MFVHGEFFFISIIFSMIFETQHITYDIRTILLDLNGTLTVRWKLKSWTKARIAKLQKMGCDMYIISWNQRWNGETIAHDLWMWFFDANSEEEKRKIAMKFPKETTAAIGNARIDCGMFHHATLRIWLLQQEGLHVWILPHIDILMLDINDALDLFLDADIFCATMKQ